MPEAKPQAFDLRQYYLHLDNDGGAEAVEGGPVFWRRLMSGETRYEGRLVTASDLTEDMAHWEMHPEGEAAVELGSGQAFVVPRGAWHRLRVREPGRVIFVTWGEGTRHRPL